MKKVIATAEAPAAIGPYSQAIAAGGFLFCSGQIALKPSTNQLAGDDVTAQTEQALENIAAVLHANAMTFSNVVKTTVYLVDLADFAAMNDAYTLYFQHPYPARSTVQVAALPRGARVEIEAIAVVEKHVAGDMSLRGDYAAFSPNP
jgi:2-iminobutanoate/2-iminopropanoate deaminase